MSADFVCKEGVNISLFSKLSGSFTRRIKRGIRIILRRLEKKVYAGRVSTTQLVNAVFTFCELYSGKTMFPYQEQFSKRVIRSVLENDGEEITSLFARQSGKSETIALTVGGMMIILPQLANMPMFMDDPRLKMFRDGFWVGIFAPSQRQATITYGRIKSRIQSPTSQMVLNDPEFNLVFTTSNGQTVALSNGSFATAISASDGSNIEGESFKLIICEECQDISNYKIRKSIHPMGAAYNATIVKIGTATTHKGDFYDAIARNKRDDSLKKSHIRNHFEYDCTVASKYNPNYAKYIAKEKARLGEKSDEFRMSYMLEWIIERGMFLDINEFEPLCGEFTMERVPYDRVSTHVAGIDLGGKGDATVVTIVEVNWDIPAILESRVNDDTGEEEVYEAYNTYIKDWLLIENQPDYDIQYAEICDYLDHWKVARIVCDATREASFSHRLKANRREEVIPYIMTTKSKSEMYKHLDKEISAGRARFYAGEDTRYTKEYKMFIEQLGDLQKGYSGQYMVVAHPDERGAHDDFPDSWALAVWGCSFQGAVSSAQTSANQFLQKSKQEHTLYSQHNKLTARRRR